MDTNPLNYANADFPIATLSTRFISTALGPQTDNVYFETLLQSLIRDSVTDRHGNERLIPINGNQHGPFWFGDMHTPITYTLLFSARNREYDLHKRIARLVSVLYLKCGIPVTGRGAALENPLTLCVIYGNIQAATALLRDTDACFVDQSTWQLLLNSMVSSGQTEMLKLFADYKSRTFPNAAEYLNGFQGSEAKYIPLFIAADSSNDPELVRVLIYGFGANPYIQDNKRRMVIDLIRDSDPCVGQGRQLDEERAKRKKIIDMVDPEGFYYAFYMSQHPRLGSDSMLQSLPIEMMARIHALSMQD
jgi:hypothetical protein